MAAQEPGCWRAFGSWSISLDSVSPQLFVTSQWTDKCSCWRLGYVVYRVAACVFWLAILALSATSDVGWYNPETPGPRWFIYLTNWGLIVLASDTFLQSVTSVMALVRWSRWQETSQEMPFHMKMQWIISNIALCSGIFITIVDGAMFYKADMSVNSLDAVPHFFNTAYLLVNVFIAAVPLRVLHFVHTTIFILIFIISSTTLQYASDISAYAFIDWTNIYHAALYAALGGVVGVFVIWCGLYALYRLRLLLAGVEPEVAPTVGGNEPYSPYYQSSA